MPKSDRKVILLFLGIMSVLSLIVSIHKQAAQTADTENASISNAENRRQAVRDSYALLKAEREKRYQSLQDSFARLHQQRQLAREEREALWQARRDSFATLKQQRLEARAEREALWQKRQDSIQALRPVKLTAGQTIELNSADSAQLVKVPGIGGVRAKAILRYRQRLGGFYATLQLLEVEGIPESSLPYFTLNKQSIHLISINKATLNELQKHPYLNFYQAKAILDYRRKYGSIQQLQQLSLLDVFTSQDLQRLEPYIHY